MIKTALRRFKLDIETDSSRQYRWILKQQMLGNCVVCGRARGEEGPRGKGATSYHCKFHAELHRRKISRRYHEKKKGGANQDA